MLESTLLWPAMQAPLIFTTKRKGAVKYLSDGKIHITKADYLHVLLASRQVICVLVVFVVTSPLLWDGDAA